MNKKIRQCYACGETKATKCSYGWTLWSINRSLEPPHRPLISSDGIEQVLDNKCNNKYVKNPQHNSRVPKEIGLSYFGLHEKMRKLLLSTRPKRCESCGEKKTKEELQSHNITGRYNDNPEEWVLICSPCHHSIDPRSRKGITITV